MSVRILIVCAAASLLTMAAAPGGLAAPQGLPAVPQPVLAAAQQPARTDGVNPPSSDGLSPIAVFGIAFGFGAAGMALVIIGSIAVRTLRKERERRERERIAEERQRAGEAAREVARLVDVVELLGRQPRVGDERRGQLEADQPPDRERLP